MTGFYCMFADHSKNYSAKCPAQCEDCRTWERMRISPQFIPSKPYESIDAMDLATLRADNVKLWAALRSAERLFMLLGKVQMTSHDDERLRKIGEELVIFRRALMECGCAQ